MAAISRKSSGRDDPHGFQTALARQLLAQGDISVEDFEERYPEARGDDSYLDRVAFDIRSAKYWNLLDVDINEHNKRLSEGAVAPWQHQRGRKRTYRVVPTRLPPAAQAKLAENGFVVAGSSFRSFGDAFHRIYSDDLPVFVGADPLLHAWHRTYDEMLVDTEQWCLLPRLKVVLEGMHSQLKEVAAELESTALAHGVNDADVFVTVALNLLASKEVGSRDTYSGTPGESGEDEDGLVGEQTPVNSDVCGKVSSALGNDEVVESTVGAIMSEQLVSLRLFGKERKYDASEFTPRGHYQKNEILRSYFRTVMWCGRTDLRVGTEEDGSVSELSGALALLHLLRVSGGFQEWERFNETLQGFVGETDSMTFAQLDVVVRQYCSTVGLQNMRGFTEVQQLKDLQELIDNAGLGGQAIGSSLSESTPNDEPVAPLPTVFSFMGQKFVLDSWALSNLVFDKVVYKGTKVQHRHPSSLDVIFSVFGRNSVVGHIAQKVKQMGLPYHSNLVAIREVVDALPEAAWKKNLYTLWLRLLRTLSEPTTSAEFPDAMRTRAWAAKDTETQAASWAQMRHDTTLYAKQSYGIMLTCEYPAGYVDPRPEFWNAFLDVITKAKEVLLRGSIGDDAVQSDGSRFISEWILKKQEDILENWEKVLSTLSSIAQKERHHQRLSDCETSFLRKIVRIEDCGSGPPRYDGWYCLLFYKSGADSCNEDLIVADVHTSPPDATGPGHVLHQGIGPPALMTIGINTKRHTAMYVGPVFRHHEFEAEGLDRVSDAEWEELVKKGTVPCPPEWKSFIELDAHG